MKKSVTVSVDSEKLSALEMYLGQKNMKLSEELEKFAEQLYQKFAAVRTVCHRVTRFGGRWNKFTLNVVGANLGHLSQSLRMVEIR